MSGTQPVNILYLSVTNKVFATLEIKQKKGPL